MNTRSRNILKARFLSVRNGFRGLKNSFRVLLYGEERLDIPITLEKEYAEHATIIMYLISKHFNIISLKYNRSDSIIHVTLRGIKIKKNWHKE